MSDESCRTICHPENTMQRDCPRCDNSNTEMTNVWWESIRITTIWICHDCPIEWEVVYSNPTELKIKQV